MASQDFWTLFWFQYRRPTAPRAHCPLALTTHDSLKRSSTMLRATRALALLDARCPRLRRPGHH
eukprot:17991-Prymnesium_polylepis.1